MPNKIIRGLKKIPGKAAQHISSLRDSLPHLPGRGGYNLKNPKNSAVASTVADTDSSVRLVSSSTITAMRLQNIDILSTHILQRVRLNNTDGLFRSSPAKNVLDMTTANLGTRRVEEAVLQDNPHLAHETLKRRLKAITPIRGGQLTAMKQALQASDKATRENRILAQLESAITHCPAYEQDELRRILDTFAKCYQHAPTAVDNTGAQFNKSSITVGAGVSLFERCTLNHNDAANVYPLLLGVILEGWARRYIRS